MAAILDGVQTNRIHFRMAIIQGQFVQSFVYIGGVSVKKETEYTWMF